MTKAIAVAFINEEVKEAFDELKEGKFEDKELHKQIQKAIDDLSENPKNGIKIKRKLWPSVYVQEYQITNLWKYDLPKAWRLIYTIEESDIKIMSIILEWFDHEAYERRFGC